MSENWGWPVFRATVDYYLLALSRIWRYLFLLKPLFERMLNWDHRVFAARIVWIFGLEIYCGFVLLSLLHDFTLVIGIKYRLVLWIEDVDLSILLL